MCMSVCTHLHACIHNACVRGVCFDEKTGVELNEKMVKEGEAVAYVAYSKVCEAKKKNM